MYQCEHTSCVVAWVMKDFIPPIFQLNLEEGKIKFPYFKF